MSHIRGIRVRLRTDSEAGSDTDDHIYIGVAGTGGGREFPLATAAIDDFERGADVTYVLGTIFEPAPPGAQHPDNSAPGQRNDPARFRIELADVDYVYIRKQGDRSHDGDDAYQLNSVRVELYARPFDPVSKRTFNAFDDLWFGNEFGHQAWLHE